MSHVERDTYRVDYHENGLIITTHGSVPQIVYLDWSEVRYLEADLFRALTEMCQYE